MKPLRKPGGIWRPTLGPRTRSAGRVLLLAVIPLSGCIDEEQEVALGRALAAEINADVPLVHDPELNGYVNWLGNRLAQASSRPDLPYRFYIINDPGVNAFALPGGYVYVTRGLIERADDLSELGGVLAHEIGHVAARHSVRQLERHLRTGSVVPVLYHLILGRELSLLDHSALGLGAQVWHANHSRAAEHEADRLAIRYLRATGLDPRGLLRLLNALQAEGIGRSGEGWFSTHPMTSKRIRGLRREVARRPVPPSRGAPAGAAAYPAFLDRIEGLPHISGGVENNDL